MFAVLDSLNPALCEDMCTGNLIKAANRYNSAVYQARRDAESYAPEKEIDCSAPREDYRTVHFVRFMHVPLADSPKAALWAIREGEFEVVSESFLDSEDDPKQSLRAILAYRHKA